MTWNVRTDGDEFIIETAFGEATFDLSDANEEADDQLRSDGEWPDDFDLEERWHILFEEVEAAAEAWRAGEL